MLESKIRISAVSYSNTLPFIFGMRKSKLMDKIDLQLDIPSDCAKKLLNDQVDIGLVPVAIIPLLDEHYIVSDYCIGAEKKVNSVLLLSDVPLNEIEEIQLDYQSRTSVNLVRVLSKNHWKITPQFVNAKPGFEDYIQDKVAGVVIGDRTFNLTKDYKYQYDLSEEWFHFTGLPFVFACWVANKKIPQEFINELNISLKEGVDNIDQVLKEQTTHLITQEKLRSYLKNDIKYVLDDKKIEAIDLFHKLIKNL